MKVALTGEVGSHYVHYSLVVLYLGASQMRMPSINYLHVHNFPEIWETRVIFQLH